jgi:hypothetical protein
MKQWIILIQIQKKKKKAKKQANLACTAICVDLDSIAILFKSSVRKKAAAAASKQADRQTPS